MTAWLIELVLLFFSFFLPEWVLFWLEDKDQAAYVGTIASFLATGILVSLLLGWVSWPVWVNWTIGFAAAFLYFFAVFCFSAWWTSRNKRARIK